MRSALAWLGLKQRREDVASAPILHSGTKGDGTAPRLNGARYFSFDELKRCTHNFSKSNKIGAGAFTEVYKGYCTNGMVLAIKRAIKGTYLDTKQFQSEIEVLSRVHHKNIVSLVGFCFEQGEQLLVYEYMSKGTLGANLDGKGGLYLDWGKRLQIALDSARALAYLRELANPLIIHRHLTSSNILLDENLNAKITDFGLSKIVSDKEKGHGSSKDTGTLARVESTVMVFTYGYEDREYDDTGLLSEKKDVYSFGVVILELITGRLPYEYATDDIENHLVEEVKRTIDPNDQEYYGLRDIIDPKIINQATNVGFTKFVQLALQCLRDSGSDRPSMSEIMKEIDIILQLT